MSQTTHGQVARIKQLLQVLETLKKTDVDDNRRQSARCKLHLPLTVLLFTEELPLTVPVFTRNISVGGMGFISRRPFKIGDRFAISFRPRDVIDKLILAEVVFTQYMKGGLYSMGACFLDCVDDPGGDCPLPANWPHDPQFEMRQQTQEGEDNWNIDGWGDMDSDSWKIRMKSP